MRVIQNLFGLNCFQRLNNLCYFVIFIVPHPNFAFLTVFLAERESAHLHCPHITVLSDVNADLLKPSSLQTKILLSVMKHLQLVDLVHAPTRVAENNSSQIDVLMTTDKHCFDVTRVFPFSGSVRSCVVYARSVFLGRTALLCFLTRQ